MNVLIVEDEKVAARRLERMVREVLGEKAIEIHRRETLAESDEFLASHRIDVLLLDLNLEGLDGFDLLHRAAAAAFHTVVVSANTDRALEAYEYGVLDFVPKPVDKERLMKAFERLERAHGPALDHLAKTLVVRGHGKLMLIPIEQVVYLQGAGDYVEVHTRDGGMALHSKSLETLERILPERFARIHKSYIADLDDAVTLHVHGGGRYELEFKDGRLLPVSRTRYRDLFQRLGE